MTRTIHYQHNPDKTFSVCGLTPYKDRITSEKSKVTCKLCKKNGHFKYSTEYPFIAGDWVIFSTIEGKKFGIIAAKGIWILSGNHIYQGYLPNVKHCDNEEQK